MRFPATVTSAHQWNKNGDHPADDSEYIPIEVDDGAVTGGDLTEGKIVGHYTGTLTPLFSGTNIHAACGSPVPNHGNLNGTPVCPGDWIAEEDGKYVHYPNDPTADAGIVAEDGHKITLTDGTTETQVTVDWYADCRTHTQRRKFSNREERDTYAETHSVTDGHIVDCYEVLRK